MSDFDPLNLTQWECSRQTENRFNSITIMELDNTFDSSLGKNSDPLAAGFGDGNGVPNSVYSPDRFQSGRADF
jgi:hypothetical protein